MLFRSAAARYLAAALARLPGVGIDPDAVQTNIVRFQVTRQSAREWVETLAAAGVRVLATGPDAIRAVTNLNVNRADIEYAAGVLARVAG